MIVSTDTRSPDLVTSSVRTGPAPAIFMLSMVAPAAADADAAAEADALAAGDAAAEAAADGAAADAAALGAAALAAELGAVDVVAVPQPTAIRLTMTRPAAARVVMRRPKTLAMCCSSSRWVRFVRP